MPELENKALDDQSLDDVSGGNKLDGIKSWGKKHSKALKIGGAIVGTAAAAAATGAAVHQHRKNKTVRTGESYYRSLLTPEQIKRADLYGQSYEEFYAEEAGRYGPSYENFYGEQ